MKAFVTYPTYREEDGKVKVHLYGRLENGESFLAKIPAEPYFWIKKSDLRKALSYANFKHEDLGFSDFKDEPVVKIIVRHPKEVPSLRKLFEDHGIVCYEADIRFSNRYMLDNGIRGSFDIEGKHSKGEGVDRVYENPQVKQEYWFPKLKVLSMDIETTPDASEVLAISFYTQNYDKEYKHVFLKHDEKFKRATSFKTEKELLEAFREKVIELNPDVIVGWNLIDFDLKVLRDRFNVHNITFTLGRTNEVCTMRLTDNFFMQSTADFPGRQVLDGIALLKSNFVKLDDYKLETAAQEFLGRGKLIVNDDTRFDEIAQTYLENPQKLVDYNLLDSQLVIEVLEKTGTLNLTIERSLLTGMPLDRVRAAIASLDNLYLRKLANRKKVAPSARRDAEREGRTVGGFVMEGKPGVYDYILVLDFKSLYPSIIRTFNVDPLAYQGQNVEGMVTVINGASFSREDGILPSLIEELWRARDVAKKRKDITASYAIKITMNSMYGVLANPVCRFYSPNLANAITKTGQHLIKMSAEEVRKIGFDVIYGDTDSIFVNSKAKDEKEAEAIGLKVQKHINDFFAKLVKEKYNRENFMELEFEKVFIRFLMPTVRGGEAGAKKRYAGLRVVNGKERVDFTGMEFVRSDWTDLAKQFQMEIFDRIFHKKEVADYIKTFVDDLKAGKKDDLLIYSKSIRKDLEEYTKTTPPHVRAARILGPDFKGTVVKYVWTSNGPEPVEMRKHNLDYEHYTDKQLKPIADAILAFYGTTFDDAIKGTKQKTLFGF
ncbi:MAG: DNA polymerase II [Candidatus Woesearchaeota archaeon]